MAAGSSSVLTTTDKILTAACNGSTELVLQLLGNSNNLEPDENGYTALHYAAVNGHVKLVQCLIDRGFKVDSRDNLGYTALHLAASQGHVDVVRSLLTVSRSVNSQDRVHGNAAVHEAAWNGYSQTLRELVLGKANVNAINNAGFSALHLAAQNGHNESSRILLFAGCSPDHKNSYGDTPLHTAARYGHAGVTRILVSAKCAINETNKNGDTALHIATALKQKKITKLLLEANVDTSITNNQGETALDIARRKDCDEIVQLLSYIQVSSPRRQAKPAANITSSADVSLAQGNNSTGTTDKKKWTSIFKKNKSKDRLRMAPAAGPETSSSSSREDQKDAAVLASASRPQFEQFFSPGDVLRDFQQYQMLKRQHSGNYEPGFMPMVPAAGPDSRTGTIPGIVHQQYAPQYGVQYYRDLAGNVKQGPVGYVPAPGTLHNWPPPLPSSRGDIPAFQPPMHRHMTADLSFTRPSHGGTAQRDHLAYLRSRHNPVITRGSFQPFGAQPMLPLGFPAGPTYADHSGRPWPVLHTGPVFPGRGYLMPVDTGDSNASNFPTLQHPIYRSRSDETLSTISSRPSCQHHRVRHNGNERSMRRKNPEKERRPPTTLITPGISDSQPFSNNSVDVSPSVEIPNTRHEIAPAPKSSLAPTDSSSNPDSGYSGASGGLPALRQLAPCSESSSLRSASSGEIAACEPTLGSSCRTNSVPSICNSL